MRRNYETELPAGYAPVKTVDAKSKKFTVLMNLAALGTTAAVIAAAALLLRPGNFFENYDPVKYFLVLGAMLVYVVLHELAHGAAYKLLTHQKLTFGFSATVAFCGVPHVYVYRRAALISLLTPFVVFGVVFGAAVALLRDPWDKMYAAVLLAAHLGGCAGDLYDSLLYAFRFRDPAVLMNDTGPKQTFYVKAADAAKEGSADGADR